MTAHELQKLSEESMSWNEKVEYLTQQLRLLEIQRDEYEQQKRTLESVDGKRQLDIARVWPHVEGLSKRKKRCDSNVRKSPGFVEKVNTLLRLEEIETSTKQSGPVSAPKDMEMPIVLTGGKSMVKKLTSVCHEHSDVVSTQFRAAAAQVPPFDVPVQKEGWHTKENRRPARMQGSVKEQEINRQVEKMLESNVIRLSTAVAHSQVLLVPKPDGTWRFCIDYRRLNACTNDSESWPIPNIPQMLRRIGDKRPKFFGILDLTKGYYQAPLSESSKHYTAFVTACGLYEWNRVPMGLMGAPSYFQRIMTSTVLVGLMHHCCEVYMDDIVVYGSTEDEFIGNLRLIFGRLRKHKLTVNPKKTRLGLSSIEYVGHTIDNEGISFSRERLQEVIDFPKPQSKGELKSFLGLANYLRDNVPHMSGVCVPLHGMLTGYSKKEKGKAITWTDEASRAFAELKAAINDCQKLFYIDDHSPIHLYTDASLYGIGAYLCQVRDGKEVMIALMSRTLTDTQRRWSTIEREGFAIVEAFKKFAYLIRDVRFTLHTDHKNLVYIRDTGSSKVVGWKLDIQEYDFEVQYIKGELNTVADLMSRNPAATVCQEVEERAKTTNLDSMDLQEIGKSASRSIADQLYLFQGCIPQEQYDILRSVHNEAVGHNGVENTILKLRSAGHTWDNMRDVVRKFVKECDTCQKGTFQTMKANVGKFTTGGYD